MGILADAKVELLGKEFAKRDALPLSALAIGVGGACAAMAFGIGEPALSAVTGLLGALLALFGVKFGVIDKSMLKKALKSLEEKDDK